MTEPTAGAGPRIREARQAAGMSQRSLARTCGLSPAYTSRIELGREQPGERAILRMAAALDIDPDPLLRAEGRIPAEWIRVITESDAAWQSVAAIVEAAMLGGEMEPAASGQEEEL